MYQTLMIVAVLIIFVLLMYYNPAPIKDKTCNNCRFLSTGTCVNEDVIQAVKDSGGTIEDTKIVNPEPCDLWDWNGVEN